MDELEEHALVLNALRNLRAKNSIWAANFGVFSRAQFESRHRWWYLAKIQAQRGVPAMQELQLEFIRLRLLA